MPRISFKRRLGATTAQLVRHCYDARIKRSRALHVGTLDLRSDPDLLPDGLRLRDGEALSTSDLNAIRLWLQANGDLDAVQARAKRDRLIETQVRSKLEKQFAPLTDPFAHAEAGLRQLARRLPELVESAGGSPWTTLRPRYLRLLEGWKDVLEEASRAGILRKSKRSRGAKDE